METSDADLVLAARAGRREAQEELVRRFATRVAAACYSRVGRRGPVEDLVQETFLRAHKSLATLDSPERVGAWLHSIATRVSLDWLKAPGRGEVALGDAGSSVASPAPDAAAATGDAERQRALSEAIDALPEIYRDALVLFYYEKQSYKEMSATLEITPAAVNARLTKARALLRERLGKAP
jgi:RNA polymerase sigma-70 factor (ECF subfamily)